MVCMYNGFSQTFVIDTLKQANMSGAYYNNTRIILGPGFSTLSGGTFLAYILPPGCVPLKANPSYMNRIITYTPRQAFNASDSLSNKLTCDVMENISYFDGLGRSLQTIQVKGSPLADKDIVQTRDYDIYGREPFKYSSYANNSNDGSYKKDDIVAPNGVYAFFHPPGSTVGDIMANGITSTAKPFAETIYERSPLSRVIEQGETGEAWQILQGHTIKIEYPNNKENEVRVYNAVIVSGYPSYKRALSPAGYYPANQLTKTISKDENWISSDGQAGTTEEFKDKEGKVLLKRTFNTYSGQLDTLSTYYVYDESNNLNFILPPGSDPDNTYIIGQAILDKWCYQYRYDDRNRLVEKKIPGKGWEFMVYNTADQLVLTQDSVQRSHSNQDWKVIKYDRFGRVVLSGLFKQPNSVAGTSYRLVMQDSVYAPQHYPNPRWENRTANGNGYINAAGTYNVFPYNLQVILAINYYDNYTIPGLPSLYAAPSGASSLTQGLLTAGKTAVLKEDNTQGDMLWNVSYFDDKGRMIKDYNQHYLGGIQSLNNYDEAISSYDFSDAVTSITRLHHTDAVAGAVALTVKNSYDYDHLGRKTQTFEQINQGGNVLLAQLTYNELGQLINKSVGDNLQNIQYAYNERGWVVRDSSALFNMRLKYNMPTGAVTPQYNGNISQLNYLTTKVTNPGNRSFNYSYDKINQLTQAAFTGGIAGDALDEQLTYDVMGNILTLNRSGTGAGILNYTYNGNQLASVTGYSPRSYQYDGNGNATSDKTGNSLSYNMLNRPQKFSINGVTKATYIYDATGSKLRNIGTDGAWDYTNGIVYHNGIVDFIGTDEGRIKNNAGVYTYTYDLKDHLGTTRVSIDRFNNAARVVQEDEYYSFGLRKPTGQYNLSNNNRYLYNGKELQVDLENQYDYGARFYDPLIGRWMSVDPLAENYQHWSPYNYGVNNPITNIDPDGRGVTTRYVNPLGQTIINTNDGRDDIYVVPWNQMADFVHNINLWEIDQNNPGVLNSQQWNNYWRGAFTQLISDEGMKRGAFGFEGLSDELKQEWIYARITGKSKDQWQFNRDYAVSLWKDPVVVVGSLLAFTDAVIRPMASTPPKPAAVDPYATMSYDELVQLTRNPAGRELDKLFGTGKGNPPESALRAYREMAKRTIYGTAPKKASYSSTIQSMIRLQQINKKLGN